VNDLKKNASKEPLQKLVRKTQKGMTRAARAFKNASSAEIKTAAMKPFATQVNRAMACRKPIGAVQIRVRGRSYTATCAFSDADYLIDPAERIVGFSFLLYETEAILETSFVRCANVTNTDRNFMKLFIKDSIAEIQSVQNVGTTLYAAEGPHYVLGIWLDETDSFAFHVDELT
jgi:hypothetical protein